jgi:2'-hydroxyisoflavone reductase
MKILILGGTNFLGRVFVREWLKKHPQYPPTLCHRGKTNNHEFPQLARILYDREIDDMRDVYTQNWDIVVDFSSYYPDSLRVLANKLLGKVGRYIYVSTVSVYDWAKIGDEITENSPILACPDKMRADKTDLSYGQRKAACERELLDLDRLDTVIFRPSVVFGDYDYIDRHYYWLWRAKTQANILLPAEPFKANYTFVNDLAELITRAIFAPKHSVTYNSSTHAPHTITDLVQIASDYFQTAPKLHYLDKQQRENLGINGGKNGLGLWFGLDLNINNERAIADFGIKFTPLVEAIQQTADYYQSIYKNDWKEGWFGLRIEQEKEILAKI